MAGPKAEMYPNVATIELTESAANTLTYVQLQTGVSMQEKVAWIIHRIEYYLDLLSGTLNTDGDSLTVALLNSNRFTTIASAVTYKDPAWIDGAIARRVDLGAAASGFLTIAPMVKDFTNLPGGGMLIPPIPVFGAIQGVGLGAAGHSLMKLFYTVKTLSTDEYWELVEARRTLSA